MASTASRAAGACTSKPSTSPGRAHSRAQPGRCELGVFHQDRLAGHSRAEQCVADDPGYFARCPTSQVRRDLLDDDQIRSRLRRHAGQLANVGVLPVARVTEQNAESTRIARAIYRPRPKTHAGRPDCARNRAGPARRRFRNASSAPDCHRPRSQSLRRLWQSSRQRSQVRAPPVPPRPDWQCYRARIRRWSAASLPLHPDRARLARSPTSSFRRARHRSIHHASDGRAASPDLHQVQTSRGAGMTSMRCPSCAALARNC